MAGPTPTFINATLRAKLSAGTLRSESVARAAQPAFVAAVAKPERRYEPPRLVGCPIAVALAARADVCRLEPSARRAQTRRCDATRARQLYDALESPAAPEAGPGGRSNAKRAQLLANVGPDNGGHQQPVMATPTQTNNNVPQRHVVEGTVYVNWDHMQVVVQCQFSRPSRDELQPSR